MPLLKKINTQNYTIGIWKVKKSEYEQFIDNHLYPNYHPDFLKFKNSNRKWQVQAVKLLFKELSNKNELISKNGIPYIKEGNKHVSISHTKDIVVLIIANFPCGIDIEEMVRDATKIKDKFINKKDTYFNGSKREILKFEGPRKAFHDAYNEASIKVDDIDLAVNLNPSEVCECLKNNDIEYYESGILHGTVTAIINKYKFEITSLRKDVDTDGRHAKVEFSKNWKEDASRRDFTFNSIYADIDGNLFDPFDGKKDLENGKIDFIGDAEKRVKEDYLRVLRYIRFYLNYSKNKHDPKVIKVIKKNL